MFESISFVQAVVLVLVFVCTVLPVLRRALRTLTGADKYKVFRDTYKSFGDVQEALRGAGVEGTDLIIGIDFTKSNEWLGARSFGGRSLHDCSCYPLLNPYQRVIRAIGGALRDFDDDQLIPTYGFGDVNTRQSAVFSFLPGDEPVHTLEGVLALYSRIAPHVQLSGPTSFAPLIEAAIDAVVRSGRQYHILVIIADGQVSSTCLEPTAAAIVRASDYPLSIIMVGVGDGPWHAMRRFDDALPRRRFDNFQFVDFGALEAALRGATPEAAEASFAMHALMEVPRQYAAIKALGLLGDGVEPALPPPPAAVIDPPVRVDLNVPLV